MNISQHAFLPRTRINKGKYYSSNSSLNNISSVDTFTLQSRDSINCVLFCSNYSTTVRYFITLHYPYYNFSQSNLPEDGILIITRTSNGISFGNRFTDYPDLPRGFVFYVGFHLPFPVSLSLISPEAYE